MYLWVQSESSVVKPGITYDVLSAHWARYSTITSYRQAFFVWAVDPDAKLKGKNSIEKALLRCLSEKIVGSDNEVLYRYNDKHEDLLPLYVQV